MRLFFYYASHSLLNTLRKVMKTWVALILVFIVFGCMIGFVGGLFDKKKGSEEPDETSIIEVDENGPGEEIGLEDAISEKAAKSKFAAFMNEHGLTKEMIVDLAISAVFLLILATNILNSQNSSKIFLPADVPMLFSSPMKPQSVLMFRLLCTLGTSLLVSLFMLFQLPNLTINAGLSMWGAVSLVIVYAMILVFSTLVQVIFYTITSKLKSGTGNIKTFLAVVYGAIALGFAAFIAVTRLDVVSGLFAYFASPKTHWVPFWGWLRGMVYFALTGDTVKSLVYRALFIVGCVLIIVLIWNMKADFYENAMFAAEKVAAQLENQQNAANGGMVTRSRERSAKLERDGFSYGSGASVFFYKAVYNRFRFAKGKLFTVKFLIYTFVAVLSGILLRNVEGKLNFFFVPAVIMMGIAYFGSIGNPLQEDTSREFFILIPETPLKKVWASLLGVIAVNGIDLIIPMIIAAIFLKATPLDVLAWLIFILSVVCFVSTAGTFINLSVPGDHAQTIKMMLQMMIGSSPYSYSDFPDL